MDFNSKKMLFLAFFLISSITGNALARQFILKNNSMFDVFYRCRSNEEAAANANFDCTNGTLKPGESQVLDSSRNYSIKTAGTSSLMKYSSFYDVPMKKLLEQNLTKHSQMVSAGFIPVCVITSGISYGWNFKLEWMNQ
jgi:hypothetical protein